MILTKKQAVPKGQPVFIEQLSYNLHFNLFNRFRQQKHTPELPTTFFQGKQNNSIK